MSDKIRKTLEIDITGDVNKTLKDVEKSTKAADTTVKDLKQQYRELIKELQSGKLSGKEFDEATKRAGDLKDQIGDINQRINNLASDTKKLDAFLDIGSGIAGGFAAAQGAAALFGDENDKLQETLVKVQGSLAVLNGIQAVANTLNKDAAAATLLSGTAQKAYSIAVGTSTGALKLFRIALISTGIGAIIVGIGLLVANFDKLSKFVSDGVDKFNNLGGTVKNVISIMFPIIGLIKLIGKGLEELGIIDDKATRDLKKNAEEKIKSDQRQLVELEKKRKKTSDYYDFEIEKAKAAGKNTEEIERLKRDALLKSLFLENEVQRARIQSGEASRDEIKKWNERQEQIIELQQKSKIAEIESETKRQNELKKIRDKASADREKSIQDENNRQYAAWEAALNAEKSFLEKRKALKKKFDEDKALKEENLLNEQGDILDRLTKARERQLLDDDELALKEIERSRYRDELKLKQLRFSQQQISELLAVYDTQRDEVLQRQVDKEMQIQMEKAEAVNELYQQSFQFISDLSSLFLGKSENDAKKAFKIDKALKLVEATNSGIQGTINAYSNAELSPYARINPAWPAIRAGIAGAFAAANIAKIASSQYNGASSTSTGGGAAGGGGGGAQPVFNIVGQSSENQLAETISRQQNQPVKAYVVTSEVSTGLSLDRNRINNSTFL